ncbi:hypothetical protein BIFBRE_03920 [Bifidobacterium breve DSM 20213 = JCM 1192]|uniref:Uncharacterized protein n=1 Tax=Bifidobacterium breve DSM 20213 = JCM 1192 TaxID=518634 RepID=D4BPB1_BIFBR|nr:hypothetical protein BIFBRE_03920 [Bifidobacterium breve DSM 20213 = JCM 1192]
MLGSLALLRTSQWRHVASAWQVGFIPRLVHDSFSGFFFLILSRARLGVGSGTADGSAE